MSRAASAMVVAGSAGTCLSDAEVVTVAPLHWKRRARPLDMSSPAARFDRARTAPVTATLATPPAPAAAAALERIRSHYDRARAANPANVVVQRRSPARRSGRERRRPVCRQKSLVWIVLPAGRRGSLSAFGTIFVSRMYSPTLFTRSVSDTAVRTAGEAP
jgi:hypothetical protein